MASLPCITTRASGALQPHCMLSYPVVSRLPSYASSPSRIRVSQSLSSSVLCCDPLHVHMTLLRRSCFKRGGHLVVKAASNISEDTDDMFDDLFKKYGKVVFRSKDQRRQSAEVDDDAQSLSFAVEMAKVANDTKGAEIKVLFVKPVVNWTKFFIIVTAFSNPQIDAIRTKMRDLAEEKYRKSATGDARANSWTLLDFGDVVVHIFLPPQRAFYNLEEFYGNAPLIELPFEDQQQYHF
ncbi:hypothetical protein Droror1_Dr00013090 [Drosera rotundifolia]